MKTRRFLAQAPIYLFLILGLVVVAYPFFFMLMNSVKPGMEILHYPNHLPTRISWLGYIRVFRELNLLRLFANTLFVSGTVTILSVLCNAMVGYALAKLRFPGRNALFTLMLATMMIPSVLLLVPSYMMMYRWGWVDTYLPLILPAAVSAFNIFLIRQFVGEIPDAYLEAARLDGATEWQLFWRIILPMSGPVLSTVAILTFMAAWNDLFGPLLWLRDEKLFTLQLALQRFEGTIPGQFAEERWAATTLVTLPVVFVYLLLQRSFIKAFTNVGLK
ncbi:MAG TPA: carbohydrate ABC transporter permease [Symbiobacteriaceae bacterium]